MGSPSRCGPRVSCTAMSNIASHARSIPPLQKPICHCRFVLDSAAVPIDTRSLYQPDALVYCGEPVSPDALEIPHPVVVLEVLSPGNAATDLRDKLQGSFRVPSVQHYLIVDPDKRLVIHHARGEADVVATRFISEGSISLDPPGIELQVRDLIP